jgi:hypothetical protein
MEMPVAEILAGIALVKASVSFIKDNISTCKDIGDIAGAVDNLLKGKDEVNRKRSKKGLGVREQFDTSHIARETIDAKLAAEQLQEISHMINLRFGPDTWREIITERARRIQAAKEEQRLIKKQEALESAQQMKEMKQIGGVFAILFCIIGIVVGTVAYNRY